MGHNNDGTSHDMLQDHFTYQTQNMMSHRLTHPRLGSLSSRSINFRRQINNDVFMGFFSRELKTSKGEKYEYMSKISAAQKKAP